MSRGRSTFYGFMRVGMNGLTRNQFGSAVAVSGAGQGETPQSLVTPVFAGFPSIVENAIKAALTT